MIIKHDPKNQKFYINSEGSQAYVSYDLNQNVMNIISVYVPEKLRGRGLSEKLALHVFEYVKTKGYKIIPTCPYVRNKFLKEHKEFNTLITNN